jgi:hypothetical protein
MSERTSYAIDVVNWSVSDGGSLAKDVGLPTITGDRASAVLEGTSNEPVTVFILGLAEELPSAIDAVEYWETKLQRPAAAAWLAYNALPVSEANLERIAVEGPQRLAEHFGNGRKVHLVTNSLGCLGVNAAAEAPEKFSSIVSIAPFAIANEYRGRLPFIGNPFPARGTAMAWGLGVQTLWQLRRYRNDPAARGVVDKALTDMRAFGLSYLVALDHALSKKIGHRTTDSFVKLARDPDHPHPELILAGEDDKVACPAYVARGLGEAAIRNGIDEKERDAFVRSVMRIVPWGHVPWCIPEGIGQLSAAGAWLTADPPESRMEVLDQVIAALKQSSTARLSVNYSVPGV